MGGLSWEAAFTQAVAGVADLYDHHTKTLVDAAITSALCLLVLPAWALYILPRAVFSHGAHGGKGDAETDAAQTLPRLAHAHSADVIQDRSRQSLRTDLGS